MTNEELQKILDAFKKFNDEMENSPDPQQYARDYLYNAGFINKDLSHTKQFGGDYTDNDHPRYKEK